MADRIVRSSIAVFSPEELPATYARLSVYRGVIVCWDHDRDTRVLEFIDGMTDRDRAALLAVHESKASLWLVWNDFVPDPFKYSADECIDVADDVWSIYTSHPITAVHTG